MFIGDTPQHIVLPGFCSALETLPLIAINGATDPTGSWNVQFTTPHLVSMGVREIPRKDYLTRLRRARMRRVSLENLALGC